MPDVLVGDPISHPSLRLMAGQVFGFGVPTDPDAICPICGHPYGDLAWHPWYTGGGGGGLPDGLLTFGGDPVTYDSDYVTYGV